VRRHVSINNARGEAKLGREISLDFKREFQLSIAKILAQSREQSN